MNDHLESILRPSICDFVQHVETDPGDREDDWVERALELSVGSSISTIWVE